MIFKSESQSTHVMTIANANGNDSNNSQVDTDVVAVCRGCGQLIVSRYYLQVGESTSGSCCWHLNCLRCQTCHVPLDSEVSCYVKEGQVYCRRDYFRFFGYPKLSSCERCQRHLNPSEMVMRVRHLIFHPNCFVCTVCTRVLNPGEHFGMADNQVFCRDHYDYLRASNISSWQSKPVTTRKKVVDGDNFDKDKSLESEDEDCQAAITSTMMKTAPDALLSPSESCQNVSIVVAAVGSGATVHNPRAKRARTSFKQHELRAMKAYFAMNHNPDAKNLRHLSNKTGLSKRVLQVWFQNARARYRRSLQKHSGASSATEYSESLEESILDLDCGGEKDDNNEALSDISSSTSSEKQQHFSSIDSDRHDLIDALLQFSNHTEPAATVSPPKMGLFFTSNG